MGKRLERVTKYCKICGKSFEDIITSKKQYCSAQCSNKSPERLKNIQKTIQEKYGVDNISKSIEIKEKIKNTFQEKYKVDNISQLQSIKDKKKETTFKNHGVESPLQSPDLVEKSKKTNLLRNGSETYNNRDKAKNTLKERYNVENISQAKHIREMFDKRFYESIIKNRLVYNVEPIFTLEQFEGINIGKKYPFKCLDCGDVFETDIAFNKLPRCPKCHKHKSRYEQELVSFIKSIDNSIRIEVGDRKLIHPQELDIYLPDYKLAIEFNGLYWHSESVGCDKTYHINKTEKCSDVGIRLIHIFEDEWVNNRSVVEKRIKYILGYSDKRIHARKCEIKPIDSNTKNIFLEDIHIQGKDTSSVYYGLFFENELVSVMTFGQQRNIMGKKSQSDSWELYRFANKYNVIGSAGRLLKKFVDDYNPKQIITYSDRRWNTGNLYEKIGFTYTGKTDPNYWYIVEGKRVYRFNYRKSELSKKLKVYDQSLSETENMRLNGYDRIWDCGSLKFILNF